MLAFEVFAVTSTELFVVERVIGYCSLIKEMKPISVLQIKGFGCITEGRKFCR